MYFIKKLVPKLLFSICIAFAATATYAQTATTATKTVTSSNNLVVILMGFISLILAFVIWGMGNVLVTLGKQLLNKNKPGEKFLAAIMVLGFALLSLTSGAQAAPAEVIKVVPNYGGMDSTGFWVLAGVITLETILVISMMVLINRIQSELIIKEKNYAFKIGKPNGFICKAIDAKLLPLARFCKACVVQQKKLNLDAKICVKLTKTFCRKQKITRNYFD